MLSAEQQVKDEMRWMMGLPKEGTNLVRKQRIKARQNLNDAIQRFLDEEGQVPQ